MGSNDNQARRGIDQYNLGVKGRTIGLTDQQIESLRTATLKCNPATVARLISTLTVDGNN